MLGHNLPPMPMPLPLGDLMLYDLDNKAPAKFVKALAVIANDLHRLYSVQPWIDRPDRSKDSCILCSYTVRDFLRSIGIPARVRSASFVVRADNEAGQVHSLGIGAPPLAHKDGRPLVEDRRWDGHLVVTTPDGWLIDTTLYQAVERPAWRGAVPGMIAVPVPPPTYMKQPQLVFGCKTITGVMLKSEPDYAVTALWLDRPDNPIPTTGDAKRERRRDVLRGMLSSFGEWNDGARCDAIQLDDL